MCALIGGHRIPVESFRSGCCCCSKQDLKKEAQRTNRFNTTTTTTTTSNNSRPSSSTSCNHLESNSRLSNDYKTQDNNDVPCINIILKPILDPKSEQKDKGIQIVEITAVKDNSMKDNFIDDTITTSKLAENKEEPRSSSPRMNEKLYTKCDVEIQTENGEYCRDASIQTETKNVSTAENKSVQFRDDKRIKDNFDETNLNLNAIQFLSKDDNSLRNESGSVNLTECFDSTKTLYESMSNSEDKVKGVSHLETCMKIRSQREGDSEKLSERINRKIDKLSIESKNHDSMSCNDTCKTIPTQAELMKTYSEKAGNSLGKSFSVSKNTDTLPSVLSNNSPIPRISIDTTEFESPGKNKSSKVTIETIFSESCVSSSLSNPTCCSEQNSNIEDSNSRSRNLRNSSENLSSGSRQDLKINRITKCKKEENKSTLTDKNSDKFNDGSGIGRTFFNNEDEHFSELSIDGNLSSGTGSKNNHSDGVDSIGNNLISYRRETPEYENAVDTRSDISLPKPIDRSALIASDLTRPEFIRMLTEIKEHTCNLEMQLSAMNETMKRKEANRTKTFGFSIKNYTENSKTINESVHRTSEVSLIENVSYTQEDSCCGPSDEISFLQNSDLKNKSEDNENCCEDFVSTLLKSHKKLKPSSRINRSDKSEEVIVLRDESNISLRKQKSKNKPVFKTKRSYLWNPYRNSDNKTRNEKMQSAIISAESLAAPRIISELSMLETKIDVSCSPTNCCSVYEIINQSNAQSSFLNSTPKKVSTRLCGTVKESEIKSGKHGLPKNLNIASESQDLNLNSFNHSNIKKNYSPDAKIEPVVEGPDLSRDDVAPRSKFESKKPKLRSRLGVKQIPFENKTKDYRKIIQSNSRISSSMSRESLTESSPNESLKYSKTRENFANRFSSQLSKLSPIPRLNREPINIKNSSDTFIQTEKNSQACVDTSCCDMIISKVNVSSNFSETEFLTVEKTLAENCHSAHSTEQDFSFSVNNSNRINSEEEVHSMDYPESESVREYNCDELKNGSNGKKRKRKSDGRKSIKFDKKPGFNNSVASEARDSEQNCESSQYQEHSENNSISKTISESLVDREQCGHMSDKFCQSNSKQEDSKCTIRVTVSLDEETPSNEPRSEASF